MFKSSKWRSEKIKVVFKMQFQATQVPQIKAKTLTLSVVPADVGKPTVRLEKAPIFEGNCFWEHPIFETVKLVREPKMERFKEKIFHFVVSTKSSKSGVVGENSIDLADLAEATKPMAISLPLQASNTGAILHVTIQKMQGDLDARCNEGSEALVEDFDSYGRKGNLQSSENGSFGDAESDNNGVFQRSYTDTSLECASDQSIIDKTNSFDETSDDIIAKLRNQITMLERRTEVSELEVQSHKKQAIKESKKGQELLKQIDCLKEERDAILTECEQLKLLRQGNNDDDVVSSAMKKETENLRLSLEDVKQELRSEKQANKKLKQQLQKTEDSNSELVISLRDLERMLEKRNLEISRLSSQTKANHSGYEALAISSKIKKDSDQEKAAKEVEMLKQEIGDLYGEIELCRKEKEEVEMQMQRLTEDYKSLEKDNEDIYCNLENTEREKREIQRNYSESLISVKQYKLQVENLKEEVKRKGLRHSEALNKINELETQVVTLQIELDKQGRGFEDELEVVTQAKNAQEQRAIQAEEDLRKMRLKNAESTERLQEEFKQLSVEMAFRIDENEKLAKNAVEEASDLRKQNEVLEELLQKAEEELQISKDQLQTKLQELLSENSMCESETVQRLVEEKEDLERKLALARKEAEKLSKESISVQSQIVEKKKMEENLQLELEKLKLQYNEMEGCLVRLEQENESMKKEKSKLQSALHKMEQQSRPTKHRTNSKVDSIPTQNGFNRNQIKSGETTMLKVNGDHAGDSSDVSSLSSTVKSLKQKNKHMEDELKELQERYSELSLRFAEVEGERQQLVMTVRCLKNGKKN